MRIATRHTAIYRKFRYELWHTMHCVHAMSYLNMPSAVAAIL